MPTLNQIRTKVDDFLAAKWPAIVARQENFRANKGRYWQGLHTHSVCPSHSTGPDVGDAPGDQLDRQPSDQGELSAWQNVFPEWIIELFPCRIWVDVYESPQGHGWVANVEATYEGVNYHRAHNVGPETSRTQAWHVVPEPVFP